MKFKRLLAWLLVLTMLFAAVVMTACNDDEDDDGPDGEVSEEDLSPTFDGDVKTYKGELNILTGADGPSNDSFNVVDVVADNNLGDAAIVKAVRERNQRIKDNFGVEIKRIKSSEKGNAYDVANNAVQTESNTYDVFRLQLTEQINLACNGGMLDLYNMQYIDITAPWWDEGIVDDLLLAGRAYYVTGDALTGDKDATYCTLFNEKLLEEYNKGVTAASLYALVKEGDGKEGGFTMEYLNRIARQHAISDSDGKTFGSRSTQVRAATDSLLSPK